MCQNNREIKFCTCEEIADIESNQYIWMLRRLVGKKPDTMIGKVAMPSNDLGGGVTADKVIDLLNANRCFDFEYTPGTDDTLSVSYRPEGKGEVFFSLIYKNGKWQTGNTPPFISIKETIAKGVLTIEGV